ncbi:hypothetical protein N5P32_00525 [Marinomonas pontica]|uniref:hypothetical protein n=1 Tax=Marinomonas pontica TaxID=264739 RepID=UPI002243A409|nr:hypothetical protein [Marinomonas pontica]MCW8354475.1 hypothetical protein [Marinomonas pontica]
MFGVGLSGYESYSVVNGVNDYSQGREYLKAVGVPVTNIYIEVLATTGIFGGFGFFCFIFFVLYICFKNRSSPFSKATVVMLIILNFESNFLRPYFWLSWGLTYYCYFYKRRFLS